MLPWIHAVIRPSGGISLCCRSKHEDAASWAKGSDGQMLTVNSSPIDMMTNSDKFIEVREKMLSDSKPVECEGCWQDESAGVFSKRQYENNRWQHVLPNIKFTKKLDKIQYKYIELRLGNVCNCACMTCNANSSSLWLQTEKIVSTIVPWFKCIDPEDCSWIDSVEFYEMLAKHSNEVEEIYINGGEPTLIKAHYTYLDQLVKNKVAKNIKLVYSLNMTQIPDELIALWTHFKQVVVNASIDDVNDRNFYIRYPTKWPDVINSLEKLAANEHINWHVTQTVSIFNVSNLHKLSDFLSIKYNKIPHHNYVLYPDYLSLAALPDFNRIKLKEQYADLLPVSLYSEFVNKLDTIGFEPVLLQKAKEFITAVDSTRNLKVTDYIPEMKDII